jgi:hypothetical protein
MKATVRYIQLVGPTLEAILLKGWDCPEGAEYHEARAGNRPDSDLYHDAATLDAGDNEEVWTRLQNLYEPWTSDKAITCLTDFPRSMDVGDIIVWENGDRYVCEAVGFRKLPPACGA